MTRKLTSVLISSVAVLAVTASAALAQSEPLMRGMGDFPRAQATVRVSPDVVERAVVAKQREQAAVRAQSEPLMRGLGDFPHALATVRTSPDVVDRAVVAKQREQATKLAAPQKSFGDQATASNIEELTSSGREIEWPQIGIGFGVGILLALAVFLAIRLAHIRPLAHR